MCLLLAAALCLAPAPQDAIEEKVVRLVERLGDEDIAGQEAAFVELTRLGKAALEPLRACVAKAAGDLKMLLERAARQIEHDVLAEERLARRRRVTIRARERPLREVLDGFHKQSGETLWLGALPADARVTVDVVDAAPWLALDAICRAHGRIMFDFVERHCTVGKAPYADRPRVEAGGIVLYLETLDWTTRREFADPARHDLRATMRVVWPSGAAPDVLLMEVTGASDDKGNALGGERYRAAPSREAVTGAWCTSFQKTPDEGASRVTLKGEAILRWVLTTKTLVALDKPVPRARAEAGAKAMTVARFVRQGDRLVAAVELKGCKEAGLLALAVRDAGGALLAAGRWCEALKQRTLADELVLPDRAEPARLEILAADDMHELRLPFEFKNVRIR